MSVDFSVVLPFAGPLAAGAAMTLLLSCLAVMLGAAGGLTLCFLSMSQRALARRAAAAYISFFRGTPLLVQLLISFYFLPPLLGVSVPPLVSAIAALAMNTSAFQAEIYRGGLQSLPRGHLEAARMLGLSVWQARRVILIPQMLRLVLPPLTSEAISILKSSSLVSVVAVTELMRASEQATAITFRATEFYVTAALIYLALSGVVATGGRLLERRLARGAAA